MQLGSGLECELDHRSAAIAANPASLYIEAGEPTSYALASLVPLEPVLMTSIPCESKGEEPTFSCMPLNLWPPVPTSAAAYCVDSGSCAANMICTTRETGRRRTGSMALGRRFVLTKEILPDLPLWLCISDESAY
eukprot:ANDGO_07307.mRNA.1 hypothetical protein